MQKIILSMLPLVATQFRADYDTLATGSQHPSQDCWPAIGPRYQAQVSIGPHQQQGGLWPKAVSNGSAASRTAATGCTDSRDCQGWSCCCQPAGSGSLPLGAGQSGRGASRLLAARLAAPTRINFQAQLLRDQHQYPAPDDPDNLVGFDRLLTNSTAAVQTMCDVVWSIDARANSAGALHDRMRDYLDQLGARGFAP